MSAKGDGWQSLLKGWPGKNGRGSFPIPAYSEFMPSPHIGRKPYGTWDTSNLRGADPHGWQLSEREERTQLAPGLLTIGTEIIEDLVAIAVGKGRHKTGRDHLTGNIYWPDELASGMPKVTQERFLVLSPLALSLTQDDKGRVRWTLFGGSDEGPSRGFWQSFYAAPGRALPAAMGRKMIGAILTQVYGEKPDVHKALKEAGLRILPDIPDRSFPTWHEVPLPRWTNPLVMGEGESLAGVRYVLTFRPFAKLPSAMRAAYLAGEISLLPYPGSLVFWGSPHYRSLAKRLHGALQLPLLQVIERHEAKRGIRVPQCGWMHEPTGTSKTHSEHLGPLRNQFRRSHRWEWIERDEEMSGTAREDSIHKVLFSAHPDDVGLYDKPMGRNAQVWSEDFKPVLDGPNATGRQILKAIEALKSGGSFGYRMYYPPATIGWGKLLWHRPVCAWRHPMTGRIALLEGGPAGYMTARDGRDSEAAAVEVWPRMPASNGVSGRHRIRKASEAEAVAFADLNLRKLEDARAQLGGVLPLSFARSLITTGKAHSLKDWMGICDKAASLDPSLAPRLAVAREAVVEDDLEATDALTYKQTATRDFEESYWRTIAELSAGDYLTKNNGDVIRDPVTRKHRNATSRDLDPLGDYLISYYRDLIAKAGLSGKAVAGEHRFRWRTDFDFEWMGGWNASRGDREGERNIICVIPGRNRREAVVLGDHYDTAYMEDVYGYGDYKGDGARVAAAGADDNNSATATLLLAAPVLLEMSRKGKLGCDVWLVHLTGEEFPSDCLGARNLSEALVEGSLELGNGARAPVKLSGTRVRGLYVMDMIAHNNDRNRDVFQMAPGSDPQSMWLALQAQRAAEIWRLGCDDWNMAPDRIKASRGKRSKDPAMIPEIAKHLAPHGEVRPHYDPRSTLFNTDGQVFSDAGVPVVLFMENYDINRQGYHDTHDTMENIDLDYGAAVAAICIEAAARAANGRPPSIAKTEKRMMGRWRSG
jgi:hypothetical protein